MKTKTLKIELNLYSPALSDDNIGVAETLERYALAIRNGEGLSQTLIQDGNAVGSAIVIIVN
jgi:hypothetical protein